MHLEPESVTVQGNEVEIKILTNEGADIDCEVQQTIPVEIFVEDSANFSTTKQVCVYINIVVFI